ncbi:MAG TPA: hypothetical protein VME20_13425 [Acidimicrobiales bacterium]|nr:hypothetical protein [Acidimicrobiales bacterium]
MHKLATAHQPSTARKAATVHGHTAAHKSSKHPWAPSGPQQDASGATLVLLDAWSEGSRQAALADASPSAVAALFSHAYPADGVDFRGCSTPPGDAPSICSVRVGNNLLELTASLFKKGWAITAALMES